MSSELPAPIIHEVVPPSTTESTVVPPDETTDGWVETYLNTEDLRANTRKTYRSALQAFRAFFQFKPLDQITFQDVQDYAQYLRDQGKAASTIVIHNAALRGLYRYLCERGLVDQDPTRFLRSPRKTADPEHLDISPEAADRMRLTASLSKWPERDRALLELLFHGLRASEASKLNIGDYQYEAGSVYEYGRVVIKDAKWNSNGSVPLLQPLSQQAIEAYLGWLHDQGFDTSPDQPLLRTMYPNLRGERLKCRGIYDIFCRIAAKSDVYIYKGGQKRAAHPHVARHAFALHLIKLGMDPQYARRLTRHSSDKTFSIYANQAEAEAAVRQAISLSRKED